MRFYPHQDTKKIVFKDGDMVAEFDLAKLMGELETVGGNIETNKPKKQNIFVPAFIFVVSAKSEDGTVRREFVTVKLNLDYIRRLLSKDPADGVLTAAEDLTAIARQDIIRG